MQPKTLTPLNNLRIGDSFVFPKRTDVWRVTAREDGKGRVAINQFINGRQVHKYDELKKGVKTVLFLRHTVPVPGESCFMEDLKEGDVFKKSADDVHEWLVARSAHPGSGMCRVRRTDHAADDGFLHKLSTVIFVRHQNQ